MYVWLTRHRPKLLTRFPGSLFFPPPRATMVWPVLVRCLPDFSRLLAFSLSFDLEAVRIETLGTRLIMGRARSKELEVVRSVRSPIGTNPGKLWRLPPLRGQKAHIKATEAIILPFRVKIREKPNARLIGQLKG